MYTVWSGSVQDPVFIHPSWPPHVVRGLFSFRRGGVSQGDYHSLNVGLHVGDHAADVLANRRLCAEVLGSPLSRWVVGEQVHGTAVAVVDERNAGSGATEAATAIRGVDALITKTPGVTLAVFAADCVPILFYDAKQKAVGAAHSGWKGTVGHIARRLVEAMQREYGSEAKDIHVWLGPSIRQCCYEVNDVVAEPVRAAFGPHVLVPRWQKPGKYLLSLQSCIRGDLLDAGISPERIVDTGVCTACHSQWLFSHRADAGHTGRQLAAICLPDAGEGNSPACVERVYAVGDDN